MKPIHFAFLMLINVAWGFNIVPTKLIMNEMQPFLAAVLRFAFVLLLCLPHLQWMKGRMRVILATGLIIGALQFSLLNFAFGMAENVGALAIAGQLWVPFSLILAIVLLGERIRWIRTAGIVLAFAGVAIVSFDPHIFDERLAVGLVALSSFMTAVGSILMRRLQGVSPLTLQAWVAVVSIPPLLLLSSVFEPGAIAGLPNLPLEIYGYLLFSAGFSSIIGHAGLAWLLQRYPVTVISPYTLISPLLSVLFSVWILDSALTEQMVAGGLVALLGVVIITLRTAQKHAEKGEPT